MKINVLKNFGLNGQDIEAGTTVTVNKTHFGDNEQAFRDAGYFEDWVKPSGDAAADPEPTPSALPEGSPKIDVTEHEATVVDAPPPTTPESASPAEVPTEAPVVESRP